MTCRFELIAGNAPAIPRSCEICGLGPCRDGRADPLKQLPTIPDGIFKNQEPERKPKSVPDDDRAYQEYRPIGGKP